VPRIPEFIEHQSRSISVSSRKRSHDYSSDTDLVEQVADILNAFAEHGLLSENKARDVAMFYSNLIKDGKNVVVHMFVRKEGIQEKLNHMAADIAKFPQYMD
jgi:hypothetical protein